MANRTDRVFSELGRLNASTTLQLQVAQAKIEGLEQELQVARTEIEGLRLDVKRLEDTKLELAAQLDKAYDEIKRISLVCNHRVDAMQTLKRLGKNK